MRIAKRILSLCLVLALAGGPAALAAESPADNSDFPSLSDLIPGPETFKADRMIRVMSGESDLTVSGPGTQIELYDNAVRENPTYTYESRNPEIATVSETGWVTPVGPGTTTIEISSPETASFRASGELFGVTVHYDADTQFVIVDPNPDGTVIVNDEDLFVGDIVRFTPKPADCYDLTSVTATDADGYPVYIYDTAKNYSFVLPSAFPVRIHAEFHRTLYLNLPDPEEGYVTGIDYHPTPGDQMYLWLHPDWGYDYGTVTITDADGTDYDVPPMRGEEGTPTGVFYAKYPDKFPITVTVTFAKDPSDTPHTQQPSVPETPQQPAAPAVPETPSEPQEPITPETPAEIPVFTDVPADSFYADAVQWAVGKQITQGTAPGTFSPDELCTRAQAVTFLWKASGSPAPASRTTAFQDVAENAFYYNAMLWAVEKGIISGMSETAFAPDQVCSRAQIATLLWRAHGSPSVTRPAPFQDVAAGAFYAPAVAWASGKNLVNGTGDGQFSPDGGCTRSQIVTILYRDMG